MFSAFSKRQLAQASVRMGRQSENVVDLFLARLGVRMIERVETGWKVKRARDELSGSSKIVGAKPAHKVAGDRRGIIPDTGRSVLVEVKYRADGTLSLSDFTIGQAASLREHQILGGVSLAAFVCNEGVAVMLWPIVAMTYGHPITWEVAQALALQPTRSGHPHPSFFKAHI